MAAHQLPNTHFPRSHHSGLPAQSSTPSVPQPQRGVWRDKYAPRRVHPVTPQPVTPKPLAGTHNMDTNTPRTHTHSRKRQTVQVAAWVKPAIKTKLQRIAEQDGLSVSQTCAALLEEAIRQQLHIQHAVLLQPIIEQAIRKHMRAYSNRHAILLVRSLFASEQVRGLVTNILGRQPGVTQPVLEEILNGSSKTAKRNITRITPQLATLIEEVKTWLDGGGETE